MPQLLEMARVTLFGSRNTGDGVSFEPARDIPSLAGKVVFITGAAGDLGRSTAIELARYGHPSRIYVADLPRSEQAKREVVDRIQRESRNGGSRADGGESTEVRFLDLDLTSFDSIRKCAFDFIAQEQRLHILILNAGIIRVKPGVTTEGYEVHFGLNYLGHALLGKLLLPTLLHTIEAQPDADARLVVVSSEGHTVTPTGGIQFDKLKTDCAEMSYSQRYGQSKLALIGLARELARHYPRLRTAAVHPGRIITGMAASLAKESALVRFATPLSHIICVPVSVGIRNHLWAATSPEVVSGKYYEPVGVPDRESKMGKDENLSRKLWEWTENELKSFSGPLV
ncbi:hypothetical protein F5Y01DRAFT_279956 [Xylaria sp. FL0043]|nr:hypothetical protein F5Y01DRAFT_279956 [Xylaria sp. FL0043]